MVVEGFYYNESADYWLIEISGIPYGLTGEMLQGGGNPWRGMIYGMTGRLPWSGNPSSMWKFWDEFGIAEAKMTGYWAADCPVRTSHKDVRATVYRKKDRVLVSIASWAAEEVSVKLQVNWDALGLDADNAGFVMPGISGFQQEAQLKPGDPVRVPAGKGHLIIIEE